MSLMRLLEELVQSEREQMETDRETGVEPDIIDDDNNNNNNNNRLIGILQSNLLILTDRRIGIRNAPSYW